MSGPSDLARLTVTIDKADEILLSPEIKDVDVGSGRLRPTVAKAISIIAVQMSGSGVAQTIAEGLTATTSGGYFSVPINSEDEYIRLYRNEAGAPVLAGTYPSATAAKKAIAGANEAKQVAAQASAKADEASEASDEAVLLADKASSGVAIVQGLIQSSSYPSVEQVLLDIVDPEDNRLAALTEKRLTTPAFEIASEGGTTVIRDADRNVVVSLTKKKLSTPAFEALSEGEATVIGDAEGAVALYSDSKRTVVGQLEIQVTTSPGLFITDPEGAQLVPEDVPEPEPTPTDPFADGLMLASVIATAEDLDTTLYLRNLLPNRSLAEDVVATVSSTTTVATETGQALQLNAQKFGPAAVLNLRSVSNADARKLMNLKLVGVAAQSVPVAIKVLILGDSIANRQGGTLLKLYLQALGINPVFIGTMKGSSSATPTGNALGELGEAREGWKTGDYTNASTDRALIIAPGDELAYLAMSKADQRDRNPFARAATGSDSTSIVRNGYVFDPAFYQSRFNLDTPEIVLHMMGTNNARASSLTEIYDQVLSDDTLIHSQIRAAWPSAKIIRTLPGTAYDSARNKVWEESYLPMIRGMEKSAANRADSKVIIAPVWAMMNPECGYEFTAGTIGDDGFYTSGWSDPIHPYGSSRAQLYRALTPYVAAAALNLI